MNEAVVPLRRYLAEWYGSELTGTALERALARLDESVDSECATGATVQLLFALAVPGDELVFCLFAACSAQTVANVCQRAGIPVQRLSDAVEARRQVSRCPPS
jgi:hypothetical protein